LQINTKYVNRLGGRVEDSDVYSAGGFRFITDESSNSKGIFFCRLW
jgi:hypothetical protein